MKTTKEEIELAKRIIDLYEAHKASWNGEKYVLGNLKTLLHKLLAEEKQTALVRCLDEFAVQWTNDLLDFVKKLENE